MVVIIDVGTMKRTRGNSSTGEREGGDMIMRRRE